MDNKKKLKRYWQCNMKIQRLMWAFRSQNLHNLLIVHKIVVRKNLCERDIDDDVSFLTQHESRKQQQQKMLRVRAMAMRPQQTKWNWENFGPPIASDVAVPCYVIVHSNYRGSVRFRSVKTSACFIARLNAPSSPLFYGWFFLKLRVRASLLVHMWPV